MAAGRKTGGRKKGTPNKDKAELLELIRDVVGDQNYHPVVAMALIANDNSTKTVVKGYKDGEPVAIEVPKYDLELRAQMHKEVAQYVAPKLKAIEHSAGEDTSGINFFMGFTEQPQVSRPEVHGDNGSGGGNGAQRPRPRAGQ